MSDFCEVISTLSLEEQMDAWLEDEFWPWYTKKYGDENFAGFILDPAEGDLLRGKNTWDFSQDGVYSDRTKDLLENVRGKAKFSLRTRLDSSEAQANPGLICPGDFPYGGFVYRYRGISGGGSGLKEESDVFCIKRIIDAYLEIRATAFREVQDIVELARATEGVDVGAWKFFNGNPKDILEWIETLPAA